MKIFVSFVNFSCRIFWVQNLKKFRNCLDKIKKKNLKLAFKRKKYYYPLDNLQLLTTAKFERLPIPKQITQVGFFSCANCIYHKNGYLKNVYLFRSNPKINCWLGTIDAFLVVTVKMFYMYLLAITVTFSILDKLRN